MKSTFRFSVIVIILIGSLSGIKAQSYYVGQHSEIQLLELGTTFCGCNFESSGTFDHTILLTLTPDSILLSLFDPGNGSPGLYRLNLVNGMTELFYAFDPLIFPQFFGGLVSIGGGLFYTIEDSGNLLLLNTNDGSITNVGNTGHVPHGDCTLFNGKLYFYSGQSSAIVEVDLGDIENSSVVVNIPPNRIVHGLTASPICNTLIGTLGDWVGSSIDLISINLLDGSIIELCPAPNWTLAITSMLEFADPPDCDNTLDLDCNDSSGATDADFNSTEVSCTMRQATVADEDVRMFYDDIIAEMTIRITGFVPDGLSEIIDITGSIPGIGVSGQGTDVLTLSNAGGAKSTDFIDALHLVRYMNTAFNPTAGLRTIEVQFTTESGSMSNVATAFIQVTELPPLAVDIGPDQIICEGTTATFDAGSFPGAVYQWSNGPMTQSISTTINGQYIVTVSDDSHCPGTDTALLTTIPVITIALTGDSIICDNQSATLTLNTNATFPITLEIQANPGSPFVFDDVIGNYSFIDLPQNNTTYTITSAVPSQEACITITDPEQVVEVFPTYADFFDVSICDGDSVWLGFYWETEAGIYQNTFNSIHGCDSVVTTNITILPAVMIQVQEDTCDASATGVFVTTIDNPNGCDTLVTTTISLLPSDTTTIPLTSCRQADTGVSIDTLSNQAGCDSLIIRSITWIPPSDTTYVSQVTCDSAQLGMFQLIIPDVTGCDSMIITTVSFAGIDTTYQSGTSCDSTMIGEYQQLLQGTDGCDSLIITTVTFRISDTTYINATSCHPGDVGVSQDTLTGQDGCDSLIILTVTFSEQDYVWINASSCMPADTGVFVTQHINQFGCDSIVTEAVTLNISHQIDLSSSSCNPADTGGFVQQLTNQFGCDSIVTEMITLLPSDQTFFNETTCLSSEAGMFITTHFNQYGCDSIVTLTVSLVLADTTQINFNTCDIADVGSVENMNTTQDGCDSLVIETTSLYPIPVLNVVAAIDYNGFDISCEGGMDGSAIANVNGVGPFTYLWSSDDTDQMITGLSAGDYDVAITDGNGCKTSGTITLTQPDVFMIGFEVSEPDCFDQQLGSITVLSIGGVAPYTYSIDGTTYQTSSSFTGLDEGIYQITSLDANDCSATEIISIDVPLMVSVDLGENQTISVGDSALLQAIINLPFDSLSAIMWTGIDSISCANCLTQIVAPIITTAYSVSVTTADGCADRDSLTVFVTTDYKVYVPNIFSPNGDGINDVLMISSDDGVEEISILNIYDRWGNLVFGAEHFQAGDPSISWDGKMKGEAMNPGVFTYRMIVGFRDGHSEVRYGDVTLVR